MVSKRDLDRAESQLAWLDREYARYPYTVDNHPNRDLVMCGLATFSHKITYQQRTLDYLRQGKWVTVTYRVPVIEHDLYRVPLVVVEIVGARIEHYLSSDTGPGVIRLTVKGEQVEIQSFDPSFEYGAEQPSIAIEDFDGHEHTFISSGEGKS